jgi:hypothetical protein
MFDEAWGKRFAGGAVPTAQRDPFAADRWQNRAIGLTLGLRSMRVVLLSRKILRIHHQIERNDIGSGNFGLIPLAGICGRPHADGEDDQHRGNSKRNDLAHLLSPSGRAKGIAIAFRESRGADGVWSRKDDSRFTRSGDGVGYNGIVILDW